MMDEVMIRSFEEKDLPGMLAIEEVSFPDPWTEQMFREDISNEHATYLVALRGEEVLGFMGYWQVLDEGHVMNIAVAPAARRQGIAAALLERAFAKGEATGILYWTLEVRVSNEEAVRLYEREGFVSAGIRPRYYAHPTEDANILWKGK